MVAIDCTVPCPRNATLVDKRNDLLVEERGRELPAGGKQNFSLDSLNFRCSIIGSEPEAPMRLAAYLSGVFPKLRAIRFEVPQGVRSTLFLCGRCSYSTVRARRRFSCVIFIRWPCARADMASGQEYRAVSKHSPCSSAAKQTEYNSQTMQKFTYFMCYHMYDSS